MNNAAESKGAILVAEDHPVNQRVATAMLTHLSFTVAVVSDGAAAVRAASLTQYRSILMDCQIPILDGFEATRAIRRFEGVSVRTPIIAMTGSTRSHDRVRCVAAGMDDYLTKPLSLETLSAVLARWVPDVGQSPHPVLDVTVIARLERLGQAAGEDLLGQLAVLFLADANARLITLRDALAAHDAAAVIRVAHTLSGASANLGATDLARMCESLETDGTSGEFMDTLARIDGVEAELERVRAAFDEMSVRP